MDNIPHSPISINSMPILVLHMVISHLDIGHVISVTQLNRQLHYSLTNDNGYWVSLLRTRLNVKLTAKQRNDVFFELTKRLPILCCDDCHEMQLTHRPFLHAFWNRPL